MSAHIIRGNALDLPLPDASVDLVVTSPPYFGLRSYTDQGEHYAGQIGSEATPAEFVDALIAATREMVRVLKPSGSIWVNLGDKYASGDGSGTQRGLEGGQPAVRGNGHRRGSLKFGVRPKSLIGIPWRYALACIDQLGLILRAEIIWAKPNGLPESVTDRVRRSHEHWFHMTKSPRYFSAVDEIREPPVRVGPRVAASSYNDGPLVPSKIGGQTGLAERANHPLGSLPGSVWTIPTQPLTVPPELGVDHFAAFPMEWPRRIIQGWSPAGICTVCGEGRRPVMAYEQPRRYPGSATYGSTAYAEDQPGATRRGGNPGSTLRQIRDASLAGYACACLCPACGPGYRFGDEGCRHTPTAPTRPAVVLDPFGGTGTTALMAKALGRTGISVDMSGDYSRLAEWRTNDPGQMAAALQVEKPEPVSPDQLDLFSEVPAR